jgi:hypothetical protein
MKTFLSLLIVALTSAQVAWAAGGTRADMLGTADALNLSATAGPSVRLGNKLVRDKVQTIVLKYDFAVQGGAASSTINLLDIETGKSAKLPKGALVVDCIIDVITPAVGAGSISISTGKAVADLKAATAAASYTGLVACVPVGSAATAIKQTADVTPSIATTVGTITAGKFYVVLQYILSEST